MSFEETALKNLAKLPKLDPSIPDKQGVEDYPGDQRKAPFPGGYRSNVIQIYERMVAIAHKKYGSMTKAIKEHSKIRPVRLSSLTGLQAAVDANKVAKKIREIGKADELEAPTVVKHRGKLYLFDGYHSLTALKLGGIKMIEAAVITL